MDKRLIYDIGLHEGQDTKFYLSKGYKVIAVDASPLIVKKASEKFSNEVKQGELKILNYAITDGVTEEIEFYLSDRSEWNSIKKEIASRLGNHIDKISVKTKTLPELFDQFGMPYYCKIDIEGYDNIVLQTLACSKELPKFVSCESECLGENEAATDDDVLETLNSLKDLGYRKFKLVDQETLEVLGDNVFYSADSKRESLIFRAVRKMFHMADYKLLRYSNTEVLSFKYGFQFEMGSSGPFGEMLKGNWIDYDKARDLLLFHRDCYFKLPWHTKAYTIWCDWHATY